MGKTITTDPITAMIIRENEQAVAAYRLLQSYRGDFWKMVKDSSLSSAHLHQYQADYDSDYKAFIQHVAFVAGNKVRLLNDLAQSFKASLVILEIEYKERWRRCASYVPDHPERQKELKFCQDFRADKRNSEDSKSPKYELGDRLTTSQYGKFSSGTISAIDEQAQTMTVELKSYDKRFKKPKIVTVPLNSLDFAPINQWRGIA